MLGAPPRMHIPDGFLTPAVAAVGWVAAIVLIVVAVRRTRRSLDDRTVPVMGVLAAFIFAAQAVNFPVAAGTSGHLIGAALASILLGPWAAMLVMTAVVVVQGFLFQDGGLIVMGWNVVNMGVVAAFSGAVVFAGARRLGGGSRPATLAAAFAAGWIAVVAGAMATAIELAASGTTPLALGAAAMTSIHALIGVGEGIITAAAIGLVLASRPELLGAPPRSGTRSAAVALAGLGMALLVAAASPLGSPRPDGLEAVAGRLGFLESARAAPFEILPDYALPLIQNPAAATIGAVALGTLIVFAGAVVFGRLATRRQAPGG